MKRTLFLLFSSVVSVIVIAVPVESDLEYALPLSINFDNDQIHDSNDNNNANELTVGQQGGSYIARTGLELNFKNHQYQSNNNENSNVINLFPDEEAEDNAEDFAENRLNRNYTSFDEPIISLRISDGELEKRSANNNGKSDSDKEFLKISINNSQSDDSNSNKNQNIINISGSLFRTRKTTTEKPSKHESYSMKEKPKNTAEKPVENESYSIKKKPEIINPPSSANTQPISPAVKQPSVAVPKPPVNSKVPSSKPQADPRPSGYNYLESNPSLKTPPAPVNVEYQVTRPFNKYLGLLKQLTLRTTPEPITHPKIPTLEGTGKPYYEYLNLINQMSEGAIPSRHKFPAKVPTKAPKKLQQKTIDSKEHQTAHGYTFNFANHQSNSNSNSASNNVNFTLSQLPSKL